MTGTASTSATTPSTLDRSGIALRIPHSGRMCLLERMHAWSTDQIHCSATSHRDPTNPLRSASGLLAPCAIEYAAQAMALHGGLVSAPGGAPRAGYIAAVRQVRFAVESLHDVAGALQVFAERLAGDADVVSYQFKVADELGHCLVEGRATVVLNPPQAER